MGMFFISIVSAEEKLVQVCMGDEQFLSLCNSGDENLGYFHNYIEGIPPVEGVRIGKIIEKGFIERVFEYPYYLYLLLGLSFFFLILIFLYKRKKRKRLYSI